MLAFGRFPEISIPIATVTNGRALRVVVVFLSFTEGYKHAAIWRRVSGNQDN